MKITVRKATLRDVPSMADIHAEAFARQRDSEAWISATLSAAPRFYGYVAQAGAEVVGYIFWAQKSGIRPDAVLELDQIAVGKKHRAMGYAAQLIQTSAQLVEDELASHGQKVKAIWVSTRADNPAQHLYSKTLGVQAVAHIEGLYSAAEVIMVAKRGCAESGSGDRELPPYTHAP